jgi:hypothetical protein
MSHHILKTDADRQSLWDALKPWRELAAKGKPLHVEVTKGTAQRSNRSLRFYWAIINEISEKAWAPDGSQYEPEQWHEFFKLRFIGPIDLPFGYVLGQSTTDLDEAEFALYTTRVQAFAGTDLHINLEGIER